MLPSTLSPCVSTFDKQSYQDELLDAIIYLEFYGLSGGYATELESVSNIV